jgi:hypothetical protein
MIPRSYWLRFRLRTLLLATLVIGAGLGWWYRPFKIVRRWPNGQLQYELQVRRAWNGTLVTNGRQRWWWGNGQPAREGYSVGEPLPRFSGTMPLQRDRYWYEDGTPMGKVNPHYFLMFTAGTHDSELRPTDWSIFRFAETEHDR